MKKLLILGLAVILSGCGASISSGGLTVGIAPAPVYYDGPPGYYGGGWRHHWHRRGW